jgi:hypothetical protein
MGTLMGHCTMLQGKHLKSISEPQKTPFTGVHGCTEGVWIYQGNPSINIRSKCNLRRLLICAVQVLIYFGFPSFFRVGHPTPALQPDAAKKDV